ncbi:hypothetical protein BD779DRAFT_1475462 [Infundibulicybe gibba]|nr:hypothetical protein BD779DRAFT_1475462 [Infundibulicybe gibba]
MATLDYSIFPRRSSLADLNPNFTGIHPFFTSITSPKTLRLTIQNQARRSCPKPSALSKDPQGVPKRTARTKFASSKGAMDSLGKQDKVVVEKYHDMMLEKGKDVCVHTDTQFSLWRSAATKRSLRDAANVVHSTIMVPARLEELATANSDIPANVSIAGANAAPTRPGLGARLLCRWKAPVQDTAPTRVGAVDDQGWHQQRLLSK